MDSSGSIVICLADGYATARCKDEQAGLQSGLLQQKEDVLSRVMGRGRVQTADMNSV